MAPFSYLLLCLYCFFIGFICLKDTPWGSKTENKNFVWKKSYLVLLVCYFLLGFFRPIAINTDNWNYLEFYQYILINESLPTYLERKEFGYASLNLIFANFLNLPYNFFFGFITALTWGIYLISSYRYQFLLPSMLFFTMTSGFLIWSFNGIRQSVAIAIFMYSIKYIIEGKLRPYIILIFTASLFHSSVLFVLPFYLLRHINFNRKFWLCAFFISLLLKSNDYLHSLLDKMLNSLFNFFTYSSIYSHYAESENFLNSKAEQATDTSLGIILNIISVLFILFSSRQTLIKFPNLNLYFIFFSLYAVLGNLFFSVQEVGRLMTYFSPIFGLLMAATIYQMPKHKSQFMFSVFFLAYLAVFVKVIFSKYSTQLYS